jgi:hypothetical protein
MFMYSKGWSGTQSYYVCEIAMLAPGWRSQRRRAEPRARGPFAGRAGARCWEPADQFLQHEFAPRGQVWLPVLNFDT